MAQEPTKPSPMTPAPTFGPWSFPAEPVEPEDDEE
jgi:hypothetical protein